MKKFLFTIFLFILISLFSLIVILSTIGIETNKFNNLISKKISQTNNNIDLKLTTIKFKIDIIPIIPKHPNAINEEGTCTYIIRTESPCI